MRSAFSETHKSKFEQRNAIFAFRRRPSLGQAEKEYKKKNHGIYRAQAVDSGYRIVESNEREREREKESYLNLDAAL